MTDLKTIGIIYAIGFFISAILYFLLLRINPKVGNRGCKKDYIDFFDLVYENYGGKDCGWSLALSMVCYPASWIYMFFALRRMKQGR